MPHYSTTREVSTLSSEMAAFIESCRESVGKMARGIARSLFDACTSVVDADDLEQVGMLEICELVADERLSRASAPRQYVLQAARIAMYRTIWHLRNRKIKTASLDMPLSIGGDGDEVCLLDLLSAPVESRASVPGEREQVLYEALSRLPARQRACLQLRYGLEGYGNHTERETCEQLGGAATRTVRAMSWVARRELGRDRRLCETVGIECEQGELSEDLQQALEVWRSGACGPRRLASALGCTYYRARQLAASLRARGLVEEVTQ